MDRERLMEIIDSNGRFNLPTVELELLADHLVANGIGDIADLKAENERLMKQLETAVVLPCKVGDTVYWLYAKGATGWYNDIRVCKVSSISISEHYIEIHSERTSLNDTNFWGRIGDNVFLTKEAAEARLEELQGEQQ